MWEVFAEAMRTLDGRITGGVGIQWNMWDIVESREDEGYDRSVSQHVLVENEPKDSVTLVYLDWWIDRNTPREENQRPLDCPELRRMTGMEIILGRENSKRKRMSISPGSPW